MSSVKDVYLEGLERLVGRGCEFDGVFSNHGPMAVDALIACNETAAVVPWVVTYREFLGEAPQSSNRIVESDWREAIGNFARVADWTEFFRQHVILEKQL